MIVFDGCLLTAIEKRIGALPADRTFFQHAAHRFFGWTMSARQSRRLDQGLAASCLMLAVVHRVFLK